METLSIWHGLMVIAVLVVLIWPGVRILKKAGRSGWWVLVQVVPVVNIVMIWGFAFAEWPNVQTAPSDPESGEASEPG